MGFTGKTQHPIRRQRERERINKANKSALQSDIILQEKKDSSLSFSCSLAKQQLFILFDGKLVKFWMLNVCSFCNSYPANHLQEVFVLRTHLYWVRVNLPGHLLALGVCIFCSVFQFAFLCAPCVWCFGHGKHRLGYKNTHTRSKHLTQQHSEITAKLPWGFALSPRTQ